MSDINFNVSANSEDLSVIVENWLRTAFRDGVLSREIADEIDVQEVAQYIAEDVDWDDISDTIYENFRNNNMEDIADYVKEDVSEILLGDDTFLDVLEPKIIDAVAQYYADGIISEKFDRLNEKIVLLENKIADMNKKKFWKKMLKGKR